MMSRAALFAVLLASTPVFAQQPATPFEPGGGAPAAAPAGPTAPAVPMAPAGNGTDAAPAPKSTAPAMPMAGYAYSNKPPVVVHSGTRRARSPGPTGPAVNMPGFESLPDGGSRLFVQLSQSVPVEERRAAGAITYVLKGASPRVWNNTNALVTVHFNTPVARARLVPQGKDLLFILDLRAAATPTWKMGDATDKGGILTIDFPKGDYLDANGQPLVTAAAPATTKPAVDAAKPAARGAARRPRATPPAGAAGPKP